MNVGLWVRLEAKPEQAETVVAFLTQAVELAKQEADTLAWFAVRLGPTTFGIFDAHSGDAGRQAHLSGPIAAQITGNADQWFTQPPQVEFHDILAVKLPR